MTAPDDARLAQALGDVLGGVVSDLRQLSGGASRETWSFDLVSVGATRPLILRREPPSATDPSLLAREHEVMTAAATQGVRVPEILLLDDGSILGRPSMVMARVPGEALPPRILRSHGPAGRRVLLEDAVAQLARVHAVPIAHVPGLRDLDALDFWRSRLRELAVDRPVLELALRWLEGHRPVEVGHVVVHGDFRMGNLLVAQSRLTAVLDWELAHLGDPYEDLGWFCTKAWRFGQGAAAGGLGSYRQLLALYAEAAGVEPDPDRLKWWQVMSDFKWGVMCVQQYQLYATGLDRTLELASLGWRTCEAEWDLLHSLAPLGPRRLPPATEQLPAVSEPGSADIVAAAAEALRAEVMDKTEGRASFTVRVAARLLEAAARLQRSEAALAPWQAELYRLLGATGPAELAVRIRSGEHASDDTLSVLRDLTGARLHVLNPGYLEQTFPDFDAGDAAVRRASIRRASIDSDGVHK